MVLLSGLSTGLVNDGVSGLQRLPVTTFAFAEGVQRDSAFSRSEIDTRTASVWKGQDGVAEAEPFGNMLVNARNGDGVQIDLALFGVRPGSYLDPGAATGERMTGPGEIVVSSTAIDAGIAVGDTVVVDRLGTQLRVVGSLSDQHTFGHVDVGYVPLRTWQEIHAGSRPGEPVPERAYSAATAVAIAAKDGATLDLPAGDRAAGTQSMTVEESFGASPGYTAETSTLTLIQVFLYAISALVVGAFFTVWTIQRRHELAVLRAIGASTGYLLRDGLAQALILLVAATAVGVAIGVGGGSLLDGSGMPFALDPLAVLLAAVLLVTLGLLGAATAIKRITAVDPLTALGGNR